MGIALVGDVENYLVAGRVEDIVKRNGRFNHSEVWSAVSAVAAEFLNEQGADVFSESVHLGEREFLDVGRGLDVF